jgi:hypothetical protein
MPEQLSTIDARTVRWPSGGWLDRLRGPGGFYNLGNAIGLVGGFFLQVSASGEADTTLGQSVEAYLFGDWTATALTLATVVFFWSGEEYHRAFAGNAGDRRLRIRRGDLLSAVGAAILGSGLLLIGDPLLAASGGALHAAGKLGSALSDPSDNSRSATVLRDAFRWSVVASRVPAILIAVIGIGGLIADPGRADAATALMLLTLLVCYALWTVADLMLIGPRPERTLSLQRQEK